MLVPLVRGELNPLQGVEDALRSTIFGQDEALDAFLRAIRRARFGFNSGDPNRPRAVLLFLGPTGTGKSDTAERAAQAMGSFCLRVDCSLFSHGHEVATLVGAPNGYVGNDKQAILDRAQLEEENAILVFDEVEKGAAELHDLLLSIMEKGQVRLLNRGCTVNLRKCLIILTSNVGAEGMQRLMAGQTLGFTRGALAPVSDRAMTYTIERALSNKFKPEFINRIDETITFQVLSDSTRHAILDRVLREANMQYQIHGAGLELTELAADHLLMKSHDPRYGARPLLRLYRKEVEAPLSDYLDSGSVPNGTRIVVDAEDGQLRFLSEPCETYRRMYSPVVPVEEPAAPEPKYSKAPAWEVRPWAEHLQETLLWAV